MICFADTSALMKRYCVEPGSEQLREYLLHAEYCYASAFSQLELVAAIEFAKRQRRINSPEYRGITAKLEADIRRGLYSLIDVNADILQRAMPIIRVRRLRAPDAIQLSTALEIQKRVDSELQFLCADHHLLTAARAEGLRCRDVSA